MDRLNVTCFVLGIAVLSIAHYSAAPGGVGAFGALSVVLAVADAIDQQTDDGSLGPRGPASLIRVIVPWGGFGRPFAAERRQARRNPSLCAGKC